MDCRKYRELIETALERPLESSSRQMLDRHLGSCQACRQYGHELSLLDKAIRDLPQVSAPAGFTDNLMSRLPQIMRKKARNQFFSLRARVLGATAALVLLLGLPLYMLAESPRPVVESTDQRAQFLIVEDTVYVPAGVVINGNVKVYNGCLKVEGRIEGSVQLIGGDFTPESRDNVEGTVEVITWSWLDRIVFGLVQVRQDVKSYVKGAWR